jgi:hypothetical protein
MGSNSAFYLARVPQARFVASPSTRHSADGHTDDQNHRRSPDRGAHQGRSGIRVRAETPTPFWEHRVTATVTIRDYRRGSETSG